VAQIGLLLVALTGTRLGLEVCRYDCAATESNPYSWEVAVTRGG